MASFQAFFPRLGVPALSFLFRPQGYIAAWELVSGYAGTEARYLGPDAGAAQQEIRPVFGAVPDGAGNARDLGVVQLLSDPLAKQEIAAGTWRLAVAARLANAGATYTWQGKAALHLLHGATGERRATLFNLRGIGSSGRDLADERTCFQASISGLACTVFGGDYLCLELGMEVVNTTGAGVVPQASVYADGTTPISADAAATADAKPMLVAPHALRLSLPEAGEQPFASVSLPEAVELVKRAWPPDCQNDWGPTDSPDHEWILWQAELLKRYGWDIVDLLERETDPRRCVLTLPDWEAVLGISTTRAAQDGRTVRQRQDVVLGRLRESGPSTLFNIAAAVGPMAGFSDPSQVPLLEVDFADLFSSNQWSETLPAGAGTVPDGVAFGGGNLIRRTPVLLDGGEVWPAGALLILGLQDPITSQLHVRLQGPDFTVKAWTGGPDNLTDTLYLRSADFAGKAMHGAWQLNLFKEVGAGANTLLYWSLYVMGARHGGRAQDKFRWALFLDANHQAGDERAIQSLLSRVRHGGHNVRLIYSDTSLSGTQHHRPGRFIPGA